MGSYAILNFEDKIGETNKGAADSTIRALKHRYEGLKQKTGFKKLFLGKNSVNEHRCVVEKPIVGFTHDALTLQLIRAACAAANKVYLVMHGDPRTTDMAYTNAVGKVGVLQLCTSHQLVAFLLQVLPNNDELRVALVMCYGARCRDYRSANVNHQGVMGIEHLKTSFAYRLIYELGQAGYHATVTAVTGKIQHDSTSGHALIEREELIDVNMELAETQRQYTQDAKLAGGGELWKKTTVGQGQFDAIKQLQAQRTQVRSQFGVGVGDESNKYGKLVFRHRGSTLTIANKYGSQTGVNPGTILYSGPMVAPGPA